MSLARRALRIVGDLLHSCSLTSCFRSCQYVRPQRSKSEGLTTPEVGRGSNYDEEARPAQQESARLTKPAEPSEPSQLLSPHESEFVSTEPLQSRHECSGASVKTSESSLSRQVSDCGVDEFSPTVEETHSPKAAPL